MKQERWSEALTCIETTVRKAWSSFFSETSVSLSGSFSQESVELVVSLIQCYIKMSRLETAEYYYLRLFSAIKVSCNIDNKLFAKYSEIILLFYTSHGYYHKAITFYQELLVSYREFYGASHAITIATLYAVGDLCRRYQRTHGYWIEYYLEICTVLNKGALVCQENALRALIIVAKYYYEDCRYSESLVYFRCLLSTFVKHGKTYKFFEQVVEVQEIFQCYIRSLEESKTDMSIQISILKEYREACVQFFSASASITIHATFQLAEVCMKSEKYQFEAIAFYEHVCKYSSSTEIIKKTQTTLKTLYVKQITSTSTTTTVAKETLERATTLCYERYVEVRKTHTCTHETTLSVFRELVMVLHKRSMLEKSIKELRSIIVECITTVTSAKELIETAKFLAEILLACGYVKHGWEIINEVKLQIIYKSTKNVAGCGFNVTTIGRECFAFVAALEFYLRADFSITLADCMATLVAESLYYERFCVHIKGQSSFEIVLGAAASLRQILSKSERMVCFLSVERQTVEYFSKNEKAANSSTLSAIGILVSVLLEYFTEHRAEKDFVKSCGYAALLRIRLLLSQKKHRDALELTTCTYKFLMAHKGLDDDKEISLGFQLCLSMSNRGEDRCQDPAISKAMLELSRQILDEVIKICKNFKIDLARCNLVELNDMTCLIGEQQDWKQLEVSHRSCTHIFNVANKLVVATHNVVALAGRTIGLVTVHNASPRQASDTGQILR